MVRRGWALAYLKYSKDYVDEEVDASRQGVGMWQGEFVAPWEWRKGKRLSVAQERECAIKGNINDHGEHIYHTPDGKWYGHIKISPEKGERWFCTEVEAEAAGWRAVKQ